MFSLNRTECYYHQYSISIKYVRFILPIYTILYKNNFIFIKQFYRVVLSTFMIKSLFCYALADDLIEFLFIFYLNLL